MRAIHNPRTDPCFNLAAEEWLLDHTDTDVFMLWRNAPAVIVGRNQNAAAQIDREFVERKGLAVVRRLTGGGAVFHDLGNVNFTFLSLGQSGRRIDFARFAAPVLRALAEMGVAAAFDGRNDLVVDGLKISGNAQLVRPGRVLHHGTLLFDAVMADLSAALRADPLKFTDKAVKSVAKRVTNIARHLSHPMTVADFIDRLMRSVAGGPDVDRRDLSPDEEAAIAALAEAKYATWEWTYGASPPYGLRLARRTPAGTVEVHLDVHGGIIRGAAIHGDFFGREDVAGLAGLLTGVRHEREAVLEALRGVDVDGYIHGLDGAGFADCLF